MQGIGGNKLSFNPTYATGPHGIKLDRVSCDPYQAPLAPLQLQNGWLRAGEASTVKGSPAAAQRALHAKSAAQRDPPHAQHHQLRPHLDAPFPASAVPAWAHHPGRTLCCGVHMRDTG